MTVADTVSDLLTPVVESLGAELIDVSFNGGLLRVTIDQEGGVTTGVLTKVNRTISPILDQHDPVPGRYTLEVSSPGVERKLTKLSHFERAVGEQVLIKLEPGSDPRRLRGELNRVQADESGLGGKLTLEVSEIDGVDIPDSETRTVSIASVTKARTVFNWGPGPKPGKKGSGKKKPS